MPLRWPSEVARSRYLSIALVSATVAAIVWMTAQGNHEQRPFEYHQSASLTFLLERSYAKCLGERYEALGRRMSEEELRLNLVLQRDLWAATPSALDVARAPIERNGRRTFIRCSWFLPQTP